ncbi:mitochondrial DNA polymerase accessory subunit [Culex quinquefasciatus]|uniref:Mitochondrial DNA polymerase accessory subunit n=1 Tax=Culex quinquefasciatus TaxID=7176 RepID=B0X439_CULQU|nr:mitochondrial DNA polymerase accessory subunit [Culex quinquefasciatus]|eukprot:XP_001864411.1 mitochondrial DNA polymerase accessory subunit [Culex quinquefasciatus]
MVGGKGIVGFRQLLEACRDSKFVALGLGDNVVDGFKLSPIGLGGEELTLEQLELFPADAAALEEELGDFRFKVGRTSSKRIRPSMLRLRQCVEVATLQIVLDAFESGGDASVRIHRKLTPFKCGIVCLSDDPALMPKLRDLAKHLCNVLRKANLPVLDCSERNGGRSLA